MVFTTCLIVLGGGMVRSGVYYFDCLIVLGGGMVRSGVYYFDCLIVLGEVCLPIDP